MPVEPRAAKAPIGGSVSVLPRPPVTQCDVQIGLASGANLMTVPYSWIHLGPPLVAARGVRRYGTGRGDDYIMLDPARNTRHDRTLEGRQDGGVSLDEVTTRSRHSTGPINRNCDAGCSAPR